MVANATKAIQLFTYSNSPFGAKVYWALQYKRVEFEVIYANPFTQSEIGFTQQSVIPVLKIDDAWVQDSSENCIRLEKLYPERPFAGETDEQRKAILAADQWVNENIVALHFRACMDRDRHQISKRNATRMANILLPPIKSLPLWLKKCLVPFWYLLFRYTRGFARRIAHRLDPKKDIETLHNDVVKEFENRIKKTGFLAGSEQPSFADIGAFAEICVCSSHDFEGTLNRSSSPAIDAWYTRMTSYFPDKPSPALFMQWPPTGFTT